MTLRRITVALAALLVAFSSIGASFSDRSPFVQGHWLNRDRPGSGFDVFNAADQVALVWYTYDESSRPVWYIAQGTLASMGTQSWPLTQQSWAGGRLGSPATVGSVKLEVVDPETLRLTWDVRGHTGQWNISPLVASGIESEVDHSGHWFDPSQAGWGFNVTEQGDVLGTVIYAYDPSGAPTWVAGFGRDAASRKVDVYSTTGSCPWCAYTSTFASKVGTVTFEYRAEADLVVHPSLTFATAAGVRIDGAHAKQLGRPASTRPADRQLASFDSADSLTAYLDRGMSNVPAPLSAIDFSPAPPGAAVPFSPTNLQEQGVDEADLLKTDGRFAYVYDYNSAGASEPLIRVAAIGSEGSSLAALGTVALASGGATPVAQAGLYLAGSQLVSIASTQPVSTASSSWALTTAWTKGTTNVEVLDIGASGMPATSWRAEIDGHLVASRRIGSKVYVVTRFVPFLSGFNYGATPGAAADSNRALLAATPLDSLLPKVRVNGGAPATLVAPSALFAPPQGSSPAQADIVVVTAIDLAAPAIVQSLGVVGSVEAIYMSPANLYLATRRNALRAVTGVILSSLPATVVTDIHQLALGSTVALVGSASVEGFLASDLDKASFRMSEASGRLRVVTSTTASMGWGLRSQANTLTILEPSTTTPGMLKTDSILPNATRTQPLGLPNEELYATRFVGDRLYAVTFPTFQAPPADPLYAVDLSNAADPKILGDLVVPGFSDYLHPLPNGKLLGFGRVVTSTGIQQGLQLSLFDVGADGAPRVLQQVAIGKRGSDSALLRDHHAISVIARPDGNFDVAFPARIHDGLVLSGAGDAALYAWQQSGPMLYQVRVDGSSPSLLQYIPRAIASVPQPTPQYDPATSDARTILFPQGTVYAGGGKFWLLGTGPVAGPF